MHRASCLPMQLNWKFDQIFIFLVYVSLYLLVFVGSYKQTTIQYIWTQNSLLFFLMFVKFQGEITPYSVAVFEILLTFQIFFCLFGAKCYGIVR